MIQLKIFKKLAKAFLYLLIADKKNRRKEDGTEGFYPQIKIAYAYDGFIYLPLFLAKELKLFPECVELVYAKTDQGAIRMLYEDCSFAICDPFIDVSRPTHPDKAKLIGSLIEKPPFWLYSTDKNISEIGTGELTQSKLMEISPLIHTILRYENKTTGYYFGEDLNEKFGGSKETKEASFDESKDDYVPKSGEILVTSNLLRVIALKCQKDNEKNKGHHDIIYSYAADSESNLQNIFFTGILTKESYLKENYGFVLSVLFAIQKAIDIIYSHIPDADLAKIAIKALNSHRDSTSSKKLEDYSFLENEDVHKVVTLAIRNLKSNKYYQSKLKISRTLWRKTRMWRTMIDTKKGHPIKYIPYFKYIKPLQLLLGTQLSKYNIINRFYYWYWLIKNWIGYAFISLFDSEPLVKSMTITIVGIGLFIVNLILLPKYNMIYVLNMICFFVLFFLGVFSIKEYYKNKKEGKEQFDNNMLLTYTNICEIIVLATLLAIAIPLIDDRVKTDDLIKIITKRNQHK